MLNTIRPEEQFVNIYLNYMVLGVPGMDVKQRFFQLLVSKIIKDQTFSFSLPSTVAKQCSPVAEIGSDEPVCWVEHFHASWDSGNKLQKEALQQLLKLEKQVVSSANPNLKTDWHYLQTFDHFQLMDENHPDYRQSCSNQIMQKSKYDAFIIFMNILEDFRQRLKAEKIRPGGRKVPHNSISFS